MLRNFEKKECDYFSCSMFRTKLNNVSKCIHSIYKTLKKDDYTDRNMMHQYSCTSAEQNEKKTTNKLEEQRRGEEGSELRLSNALDIYIYTKRASNMKYQPNA